MRPVGQPNPLLLNNCGRATRWRAASAHVVRPTHRSAKEAGVPVRLAPAALPLGHTSPDPGSLTANLVYYYRNYRKPLFCLTLRPLTFIVSAVLRAVPRHAGVALPRHTTTPSKNKLASRRAEEVRGGGAGNTGFATPSAQHPQRTQVDSCVPRTLTHNSRS